MTHPAVTHSSPTHSSTTRPRLTRPPKDKPIAFILWCLCFVGVCGVHRFYLGKWGTALLWFCTAGLLFVGQIIDVFFLAHAVDRHNRSASA